MSTPLNPRLTAALSTEQRERLLQHARPVDFPAETRLFEEGGYADRFWIVRTGTVTLDVHVPGKRPAVVDSVNAGELLSTWSASAWASRRPLTWSPIWSRRWRDEAQALTAVARTPVTV